MEVNIRGQLLVSRAPCQARFVDDKLVRVGVKGVVPVVRRTPWMSLIPRTRCRRRPRMKPPANCTSDAFQRNAVRCLLLRSRTGQPAMNRFLSRCVGVSGNMRLLSVVNGTVAVFLQVRCSPLDQHLVIQFGTAAAYGLLSVILILLSVDEQPAQWLHPQWPNPAPET